MTLSMKFRPYAAEVRALPVPFLAQKQIELSLNKCEKPPKDSQKPQLKDSQSICEQHFRVAHLTDQSKHPTIYL